MNDPLPANHPVFCAPGSDVAPPAGRATFREMVTNAIRYWEPRRLLFNGILASVMLWYFFANWPDSRAALTFDSLLGLFFLAVLANLCYCAAYLPDIFAQFSGLRAGWLRWRWLLLALGIVFAAVITRFVAFGFFLVAQANQANTMP